VVPRVFQRRFETGERLFYSFRYSRSRRV
jgi:hypothetical protein